MSNFQNAFLVTITEYVPIMHFRNSVAHKIKLQFRDFIILMAVRLFIRNYFNNRNIFTHRINAGAPIDAGFEQTLGHHAKVRNQCRGD